MEDAHPLPEDALTRLETSTASADVRRIAAELLPAFYQQLRRIAQRTRARMGAGHTLQTTALVHEAYLRLGQSRSFVDETHFLRAAALAMRHALINYAQSRVAEKRGGGGQHVTLSHIDELSIDSDEGLLALNEAMEQAHAGDAAARRCGRMPLLRRLWRRRYGSSAWVCPCAPCSATGSRRVRGCSANWAASLEVAGIAALKRFLYRRTRSFEIRKLTFNGRMHCEPIWPPH